jgi:hypothetical protein
MWILQSLTPWTGPVERFSRSGAKNFKNMSPKMHPVKIFSEKDGLRPGFRTGVALRGWRFKVRGWRKKKGFCLKPQAKRSSNLKPPIGGQELEVFF